MVLAACHKVAETDDSDAVTSMLQREWDIYVRNSAFRKEEIDCPVDFENSRTIIESSLVPASGEAEDDGEFPDCLLTAVACLVDQNELSEDAAASLLASFAKGNELLRDVYDHFIEFGGVDDFIDMVRLLLYLISVLIS